MILTKVSPGQVKIPDLGTCSEVGESLECVTARQLAFSIERFSNGSLYVLPGTCFL